MGFHKAHTPGELIERIDGDVIALSNFFSAFIIKVVGNATLLLGILVLLWREKCGWASVSPPSRRSPCSRCSGSR